LAQVKQSLAFEDQLELEAEISETVQFEKSQISWIQRIPDPGAHMVVATRHKLLERVSGNLVHRGLEFLGIDTGRVTVLIRVVEVLWVQGLAAGKVNKLETGLGEVEGQILLHEIADQKVTVTCCLGNDQSFTGQIRSVFRDSISVCSGNTEVTINLGQLVGLKLAT
ncbi:MAG: hypothetical protein KGQ38_04805, partial [Actinomycetales bacterium]|nr:hypothetical protein [Actinomycetales bacterium]